MLGDLFILNVVFIAININSIDGSHTSLIVRRRIFHSKNHLQPSHQVTHIVLNKY